MPSLYVHLAPPEKIAAHIADDDREHGRPSALAEFGLWHKVASFENVAGTDQTDEARVFHTQCGVNQSERPDRMDEAENEPGSARCPKCFGKKG